MKRENRSLNELLDGVIITARSGVADAPIRSLALDSRNAEPGQLFFALPGSERDGHDYIEAAVAAGVAAVVCERLPERIDPAVAYVAVDDAHEAMGRMASAFYGRPSERLRLVGVTGTNGKTTVATLLFDLLEDAGCRSGLISTVVCCVGAQQVPSTHTTPDPIRLNAMMAEMVEAGCTHCVMEVSSHSIVQRRIAGLRFAGGIFTNLTHDHLDYHKTFAAYRDAKRAFFDGLPAAAFALTNADDRNGSVMVQNTRARRSVYSLRAAADFTARVVEMHPDGMLLRVDGSEVWVNLLGRFNAQNLLAVYGAARLLGIGREEALCTLSKLRAVRGRLEFVRSVDGVVAVIDYAHTPDALENVLETLREVRPHGAKLCTVVGCGGNRDRTKRPEMARLAVALSDLAILTSDNPRLERPEAILEEMRAGLQATDRYLLIVDRAEAIRTAVTAASPGDVLLIAGKGHETYQDAGGVKHPFDDREQVLRQFSALRGGVAPLHRTSR